MPRITVRIEVKDGESAEFDVETPDIISGDGTLLNSSQLRPMWLKISGRVSHYIRYHEPVETQRSPEVEKGSA